MSYGMTECCGKISMSILPFNWPTMLQQRVAAAAAENGSAAAAAAAGAVYDELLQLVCTSGRPFLLMEVSVCGLDGDLAAGQSFSSAAWHSVTLQGLATMPRLRSHTHLHYHHAKPSIVRTAGPGGRR
jgi:hypothetical protein